MRLLIVHREGNVRNNPHMWGVLECLESKKIEVDLLTEARANLRSGLIRSGCRLLPLLDIRLSSSEFHKESSDLRSAFAREASSVVDRIERRYDHILGVDLGVITGALLGQRFGAPHSLVSYELLFADECEPQIKKLEIESCRGVHFAICQDHLRASLLARECEIPRDRMLLMPVAGGGLRLGERKRHLHEGLSLQPAIRILAYVGDLLSDWSGVQYLADKASTLPENWRVVLHHRYASDETRRQLEPLIAAFGDKILLSPFDELPPDQLDLLFHSADLGLALYIPTFADVTSGKNIQYLGASSGKISGYLQHGLPVVVNEIGELSDLVRAYGAGFVLGSGFSLREAVAAFEAMDTTATRKRAAKLFLDRLDLQPRLPELLRRLVPTRNESAESERTGGLTGYLGSFVRGSLRRPARQRKRKNVPAISVIVPTCGRADSLRQTLHSLCRQSLEPDAYEVVVIENGEECASREIVSGVVERFRDHSLRYVHEPCPGLLAGRHRGAIEAVGGFLVFVDDDIDASRGWLAAIFDTFSETHAQLVTGPSLPRFERTPPSWLEQFWWPTPSGGKACGELSLVNLGDSKKPIDAELVWGLNFAISRIALFDLGGFHPDSMPADLQRFQGDGETGLTIKAKEAGLLALYVPGARVRHRISESRLTVEYFKQRAFFQGVCDSFTATRADPSRLSPRLPWAHLEQCVARDQVAAGPLHGTSSLIDLRRDIDSSYDAGYRFHQESASGDPAVTHWILKPQYWDYRLPKSDGRSPEATGPLIGQPVPGAPATARVDFRIPGFPAFLSSVTGLSFRENWGRWTDGPIVEFLFVQPLPRRLTLTIVSWAFGENAARPIEVSLGQQTKSIAIQGEPMRSYTIELDNPNDEASLRLRVPAPTSPIDLWPNRTTEQRHLGIALQSIEISERE